MISRMISHTFLNPYLHQGDSYSDLATVKSGAGSPRDKLCEYAARVCYRSTDKMGRKEEFLPQLMEYGHLDVIEHANIVMSFEGSHTYERLVRWGCTNKHLQVSLDTRFNNMIASGNLRVWKDILESQWATQGGWVRDMIRYCKWVSPKIFTPIAEERYGEQHKYLSYCPPEGEGIYWDKLVTRATKFSGHAGISLLAATPPANMDIQQTEKHCSATFLIDGVSRALTHQLVRHRLASYSQESQRYVDMEKGGWTMIRPPSVEGNQDAETVFDMVEGNLALAYNTLRKLGIKKEDARFLLPNATETRIVVTMPLYAWSHFFWLRAVDKAAQWEIRGVAQKILEHLHFMYPDVFADHWKAYMEM